MAKKYYAIRKGLRPGIYTSWAECKANVDGFSGAEYKSFTNIEDAQKYIGEKVGQAVKVEKLVESEAVAYVDGSFDSETKRFAYGVVMFYKGEEQHFSEACMDSDLAEMHNVAGEIKGSERAIQFCLDNNIKSLTIYHDYEGISKWCTGEWKTKKSGTKAYKSFFDDASKKVEIKFIKVKGHSGDRYNELADKLAGSALSKKNIMKNEEGQTVVKSKGILIDQSKIKETVLAIGQEQWNTFEASDVYQVGNAWRMDIIADGKNAILDLYYKKDGSTTIFPTGNNIEISTIIKTIFEERYAYNNSLGAKTYSIKNVPEDWTSKLVEYLTALEGVEYSKEIIDAHPVHDKHVFKSQIGDRLTVNIYKNGTLMLQGKPAYLYGEAISLLSYCEKVSLEDVVNTVNKFHSIDVKTSEVRNELETLLPRAYNNIDDMILKLLSPSIALRRIKIELEDYSCYAFPALRALEGYIKYLFGIKSITVGNTFYEIYSGCILCPNVANKVADPVYQAELERLYTYFKNNRHVIFHAEQILIGTTVLEDKHEADEIVNSVINLIETSYTNINQNKL